MTGCKMVEGLILCLRQCQAQFRQYAEEHKAKASNYRRQAAELPSTRSGAYDVAQHDNLRTLARQATTKAGVNTLMASAIDDAIEAANKEAPLEEAAFKAGWDACLSYPANNLGGNYDALKEAAWVEYLAKQNG